MKAKTLILASVLATLTLLISLTVRAYGTLPTGQTGGESKGQWKMTTLLHRSQASAIAIQQAHNVELIGQIGGAVQAVAVQDNYAYIGVGARLFILNVATPAQPSIVGQTDLLPGVVEDIVVSGTYAYVASGAGGLYITNISNPAVPTEVGFYDTPGYAYGVTIGEATPISPVETAADCASLTFLTLRTPLRPASTACQRMLQM